MPPSISAASAPLTLKGVDYNISPLSDRDWDELNNWLRSRLIKIARNSLTPDMDQESRDEVVGAAVREASKIDLMTGRGLRELSGPEGQCRMLYQSLKREHPRMTAEQCKKLLFRDDGKPDGESIKEFARIFSDLNMPERLRKKDKDKEDGAQQDGTPKEVSETQEQ